MPGLTKPPVGAQVNWGHPLASGLLEAWMGGVGASNENAGSPTHSGIVPLVVSKIVPGYERGIDLTGRYGAASFFEANCWTNPGVTTPAHTESTGFSYRFVGYLGASTSTNTLIGNRIGGTPGLSFLKVGTSSVGYYAGGSNFSLNLSATVGNSATYPAGWYDIVVVHDGVGNLHAYVNGKLDATRTVTAHSANGNPVYLCGDPGEVAANIGIIQGAVWWRALTPADVRRLYEEPWAFVAQGPKSYYYRTSTTHTASLTIAGSGTATFTAGRTANASSTVTGSGAITTTGARTANMSAGITGAGDLAVTGLRAAAATVPITGSGALSLGGYRTVAAALAILGNGTLAWTGSSSVAALATTFAKFREQTTARYREHTTLTYGEHTTNRYRET